MRSDKNAHAQMNELIRSRMRTNLDFRYDVIYLAEYLYDAWTGMHGSLHHHWNGQRMSLQQGTSHTSLEWTDGDDWAGSFPYFEEKRRKLSMVPPYYGRLPFSSKLTDGCPSSREPPILQ